jgi:acyl transferase domain-containing protein
LDTTHSANAHDGLLARKAVAIVGMSGRFPGAPDPQALWDLLLEGRDGVTEAPADRPWMRELYDPRPRTPGKVPTTRGGFLPDLDLFDAAFFDMSPREARRADPQLRILLETAHEAAQDAGVPVQRLGGERTGVFMAGLYDDYWVRQIGAFIEAHGTGTAAGDPVELRALAEVLGPRGRERARCLVGSSKVNVGHSEGAAGMVGLIKAVLCLEHRRVPGNPLLARPTPAIDWDTAPLRLHAEPVALPNAGRLLAGVNSYGASGSNAHVVLGTAPEPPVGLREQPDADRPGILAVSARSAAALRVLAARYADLLDPADGDAPPLHEVCAAAATRRDHLERRLALSAGSASGMASALRDFLAGKERPHTTASPDGGSTRPRIVFVFPGQGSHWHGMGRELLAGGGPFREALDVCDACDAVIREQAGWSLVDALRGDDPAWLQQTAKIQRGLGKPTRSGAPRAPTRPSTSASRWPPQRALRRVARLGPAATVDEDSCLNGLAHVTGVGAKPMSVERRFSTRPGARRRGDDQRTATRASSSEHRGGES